MAPTTDPNLANPWGIAFSPTSPFWISDNHTGLATVYTGNGTIRPLVVTIPPPAGGSPPAAPTGIAFNGGSGFMGDRFVFATEDGTISGWQSGTSATLRASSSGAVYKGLAIANNGTGDFLYAANFSAGRIDVFNSSYQPVSLSGNFSDPDIPAGFAPFDIKTIGGKLYVTYALQDAAKEDDVPGPGNGFVNIFDANGHLEQRLIVGDSTGHTGPLNSPWGLALAPAGFGAFGGDLLVGNFGDGRINAFNGTTGSFVGTVAPAHGGPLVNTGLWALSFGNGGMGGDPNALYFTAGIPGPGAVEDHGLFGKITAVPEPATLLLIGAGLVPIALTRRRWISR